MWQSIKTMAFLQHLVADVRVAAWVAPLVEALPASPSLRLCDLARQIPGRVTANYELLHCLLLRVELRPSYC